MKTLLPMLLVLTACTGSKEEAPINWGGQGEPGINVPTFDGAAPMNVMMISVDTVRKDHLPRYDLSSRNLMPFVDSLMTEGFVADNHRACSNWTYHGVTCTLGGRYPVDSGFLPKLVNKSAKPLPDGTRLLSHYLSEAGYFSVLGSSNSWLSPQWGSGNGYTEVEDLNYISGFHMYQAIANRVETALATDADQPWFMHVHMVEPHVPYAPPDEYLGALEGLPPVAYDLSLQPGHYEATRDEWADLSIEERVVLKEHVRVRYEAELRYTDDLVRNIFDDLEERGFLDDTLVVFWVDHGEQFWERGRQTHAYHLNVEENDTVLFLWAKNIQSGATKTPSVQIDMVPTLLGLLEIEVPAEVTGIPLGWAEPDRTRFAATDTRLGMLQAVTKGDHQLIVEWTGSAQYYDLVADPLQDGAAYQPSDPVVSALWDELVPMIHRAQPLAAEHDFVEPKGFTLPAP